jgi:hypothetical protein
MLDVEVSENASDLLDLNVEFAAFSVDSVHFTIDGNVVTYVGDGILDFTDNHAGLFDIVVFTGKFQSLGDFIEIGSSIAVPPDTFQLSQAVAAPPHFDHTTNSTKSSGGGQGPYTCIVPAGTDVLVSPEPATLGQFAIALMLHAIQRRPTLPQP